MFSVSVVCFVSNETNAKQKKNKQEKKMEGRMKTSLFVSIWLEHEEKTYMPWNNVGCVLLLCFFSFFFL